MNGFTGTKDLLALALRRDRVIIPVTLGSLALLVYASAAATLGLYPNEASRVLAGQTANASPSVIAMYGPIYDLGSIGGIGSAKLQMMCMITLAILSIAIVRRHTRAEEESGRFELLGATVVGRRAPLAAAVIVATGASIVGGLLTAACAGAGGLPWTGSWAMGAAVAGVGLSWTGLTALAAQLSQSNRTVGGFAFGSLGIAFVLRMIGDLNSERTAGVLSWLSPLGWGQQVRAYSGDRWWVLAPPIALLAVTLIGADRLQASRDLGAGLLPDRPGPARGRLGTVGGLTWRLERGSVLGWLLSFALMGMILGAMIDSMDGFMTPEAQEMLRKLGGAGKTMVDIYLTMMGMIMGFTAAAFGISSLLRLRGEETSMHLEAILGTRTTRARYLSAHALIAFLGSAALLVVFGISLAAAHATTSPGTDFWRDLSPSLIQVPALWLTMAIVMAIYGWLPQFTSSLGWAVLAGFLMVGEFGALLNLPDWVQKLSPFTDTPKLPVEEFQLAPVAIMAGITLALVAASYVGFSRRDITTA